MAGKERLFSTRFIVLYGCMLFVLIIYAIGWQQIIKYMSLTTAYCNKSVTIIWGMLWGWLLFNENISIKMVIGAIVVIAGMIVVVRSDG